MHVDAAVEGLEVLAPDELHQGVAGQHLARTARERPEQLELVAGDRPLLAFEPHDPGGAVDLERPEPERLRPRARPRAPAEDRAETGQQLAGVEGLRKVIVGADLQAHDPVRGVAARGEHQDGHVGFGPEAPAEVEAVPVREHDVEDHRVERLTPGGRESLGHRLPRGHHVARALQVLAEHVGEGAVVVVDQDAPAFGRPRAHRFSPRRRTPETGRVPGRARRAGACPRSRGRQSES